MGGAQSGSINKIEYSCKTGVISKLESYGITSMFEDNRMCSRSAGT